MQAVVGFHIQRFLQSFAFGQVEMRCGQAEADIDLRGVLIALMPALGIVGQQIVNMEMQGGRQEQLFIF